MFIIDQYAGEDFSDAFVWAVFEDLHHKGLTTPQNFRDAAIAYCNL